jgi:hypothetical protein
MRRTTKKVDISYGTADYWLSRLKRAAPRDLARKGMTAEHFAELAAHVRKGELSANAAAIEAGFRKKPTVLDQILKLLPQLTEEERAILRQKIARRRSRRSRPF